MSLTLQEMPQALSIKLLRNFDIDHNTVPVKLDSNPTSDAAKASKIIIRKIGNSWYTVANVNKLWHMYAFVDGHIKKETAWKFSEIKPHFGKGRSEWWQIPVREFRVSKPANDADSVKQRVGASGKMIGEEGTTQYANRVFLPGIRAKFAPLIEEVYAGIRTLPRNVSQYGRRMDNISSSARVAALSYAESMEEMLENGFNREIVNQFLSTMNCLHHGWGCVPDNQRAFAKLMKMPNARAKFAKTLIDETMKYYNRYIGMKATVEKRLLEER